MSPRLDAAIMSLGEAIATGDNIFHHVVSLFALKFADNFSGFTSMYISLNGTISFTDSGQFKYQNKSLLYLGTTSAIALFWDYLSSVFSQRRERFL